ncbi:DarT ssDNA thymidine ADP-ribosyltransferase family protein [Lacrimispora celerecrescens]|uniref:DarT domain-containing protein n=1 Tax=Lacrimispora celerecrescens TaxID=29354 RepID=A0A084JJZ3_9FIRM|nr:DarT ssDNA thymidine ADP-ribosyltransferase family protein [Lacrimispora celerecrescens]KEZ89277.1 hypothetical protein IO98_14910 [Lacrimispora celerecrescens]
MDAYNILTGRGVTRLCHFTKLRGLVHILSFDDGILASDSIRSDIKNVTDIQRYDGELEHICCSIEYPNTWFLNKVIQRDTDQIFREWVVLYIDLSILEKRSSKFCCCNAAKDRGRYIFNDINKIGTLFDYRTATGRQRSNSMLACCPTDDQAEVLIKNNIPRDYITGIAVGNLDVAERVSAILKTYNIQDISVYLSTDVLSTNWSVKVRNGCRAEESKVDYGKE